MAAAVTFAAAALFFSTPAPLDMPEASAYIVKENGRYRLEDRYDVGDLWVSRTVAGRWIDDDERIFTLSRLDTEVKPLENSEDETRSTYVSREQALEAKDENALFAAIAALAPCDVGEEFATPRQGVRGMKAVRYYEGTNNSAIVCAFRPEKSERWYLATWELVAGDDAEEFRKALEDDFLPRSFGTDAQKQTFDGWRELAEPKPVEKAKKRKKTADERSLLREDAHHNVASYPSWHATDSEEFVVLDDLSLERKSFVTTLTNDLHAMRKRYAEVMPSPIDGSNTLAIARIYATRDEYLYAAGPEMAWSAAYWSSARRELVAHLPDDGVESLMKTIRHEAFHQYFAYACSMIPSSPWINEGYAQYFEDESKLDWGMELTLETVDRLAELLPAVLTMDYEQFYAGTDEERRLKYRLAWSVAAFIEKGAPKVRFAPFADLKGDYVKALLKERDMAVATARAFKSDERVRLFVAEWKKFWKQS